MKKNRTNYTTHDKVSDRLWLHKQRMEQIVQEMGESKITASRIAFHEIREGEIRVAYMIPGRKQKYLDYRRAAQIGNELDVKVERVIRFVAAERFNREERRLLKRRAAK